MIQRNEWKDEIKANLEKKESNERVSAATTLSKDTNKQNRDAFYHNPELGILCVFDGVGNSGRPAAQKAEKWFAKNSEKHFKGYKSLKDVQKAMKDALLEVNREIYNLRDGPRSCTTGTIIKIVTDTRVIEGKTVKVDVAVIGNIGDSRAYLWDKNTKELFQLTLDCGLTLNSEEDERQWNIQLRIASLETFKYAPEDLKQTIKDRHEVSRVLGKIGQPWEKLDLGAYIYTYDLPEDYLVFTTSDGVHDVSTDGGIAKTLLGLPDPLLGLPDPLLGLPDPGELALALAFRAKLESARYNPAMSGAQRYKIDDITVGAMGNKK